MEVGTWSENAASDIFTPVTMYSAGRIFTTLGDVTSLHVLVLCRLIYFPFVRKLDHELPNLLMGNNVRSTRFPSPILSLN